MKFFTEQKTPCPKKKHRKFKKEQGIKPWEHKANSGLEKGNARLPSSSFVEKKCSKSNPKLNQSLASNPMKDLEEDQQFERMMRENFDYDPVSKKYFAKRPPDMIKMEEDPQSFTEKFMEKDEIRRRNLTEVFRLLSPEEIFTRRRNVFIKSLGDRSIRNAIDFEKRCEVLIELVSNKNWAQSIEQACEIYNNIDLTDGRENFSEKIIRAKYMSFFPRDTASDNIVCLTVGLSGITSSLRIRLAWIRGKNEKPSLIKLEPTHLRSSEFISCHLIKNSEDKPVLPASRAVVVWRNSVTVISLFDGANGTLSIKEPKDFDIPPIKASRLLRKDAELIMVSFSGSSIFKFDILAGKLVKCFLFLPSELRIDWVVPLPTNELFLFYSESKKLLLCSMNKIHLRLVQTSVYEAKTLADLPSQSYISFSDAVGNQSMLCLKKNGCDQTWACFSLPLGNLLDQAYFCLKFRLHSDCFAFVIYSRSKAKCLLFDFHNNSIYKAEKRLENKLMKANFEERKIKLINNSNGIVFFEKKRQSTFLNIVLI